MLSYLCVLIGSGIGGVTRYAISKGVMELAKGVFPFGTMTVNLCGCLLIGFLSGLFEQHIVSSNVRMLIFVGFLGGFTTFSTYCFETFALLRSGELRLALTNFLVSNVGALVLVVAGFFLSQYISRMLR